MKSTLFVFFGRVSLLLISMASGGGTVDFQEFVGGLSAFSSRGGREEKLRCSSPPFPILYQFLILRLSRVQGIRRRSGRVHIKRRTLLSTKNDGREQS